VAQAHLERTLSLPLITLYGVGTVLGAGIYVLIGEVAGTAGIYAPYSFLIAAIIAIFTAFSYAELSSRYPKSAGEAVYVDEAFHLNWLTAFVGWMVVLTGIVSSATMATGFVGYLQLFIPLADWSAIVLLMTGLCLIAVWGIKQSTLAITLITLIEIGGLILVLYIAGDSLHDMSLHWSELMPPKDSGIWSGIMLGSFLAFYAFIGFEDMVNVAEEVQNPRRNLPIAILLAISIATVLYILVALVAVTALPIEELAGSKAPLAAIIESKGYSPTLIGLISLFAVINGALVQIIMASRVIYGMGKLGGAPQFLATVNSITHTPVRATLLVSTLILLLALLFPLGTLAKTTSFIILSIFAAVNLSLIIVKSRKSFIEGAASYPILMPIIGLLLCVSILLFEII
jgi:basic amino acid/polyamine antiporter, APA family